MSLLILTIAILSLWHFIHESIVAPSMRMQLRNQLFILRDKVRGLKLRNEISEEEFQILHEGLNTLLPRLPSFTISRRTKLIVALHSDAALQKGIQKRRAIIDESPHQVVRGIDLQMQLILRNAYVANTLGWFIYIVPVFWVISVLSKSAALIREFVSLPGYAAGRVFPIEEPV